MADGKPKRKRNTVLATLALFTSAVLNWARLAVQSLMTAVVSAVALLGIILALLWWQHRRRAQFLTEAGPGTIFVANGNIMFRDLQGQPRFEEALTNLRRRWIGGAGGRVEVSRDRVRFQPHRHSGLGMKPIEVPWNEVDDVRLTKVPLKLNAGQLVLTLQDGSTITLEVQYYKSLRQALDGLRVA